MPKYREWDRDPEEYRPQPSRQPNQRRRWDDEDYYNDKQRDDNDYDDRDDYRDQR